LPQVCAWRDSSVKPSVIVAAAADLLREASDVEILVIACTNFRALGARAEIAAGFGVEVSTANSAVVDRTMQVLGAAIPGPG
jgi:maleate cis-trans isomerase